MPHLMPISSELRSYLDPISPPEGQCPKLSSNALHLLLAFQILLVFLLTCLAISSFQIPSSSPASTYFLLFPLTKVV